MPDLALSFLKVTRHYEPYLSKTSNAKMFGSKFQCHETLQISQPITIHSQSDHIKTWHQLHHLGKSNRRQI